ncbi:MAG: ATP-dependent DNA helicase [Lachnospiraceae bacterium]|nr:ATP-dependent DNA helicase [Lachnospiraceae bacterium]
MTNHEVKKLQKKVEKQTIKISVRNLVEFILRSGDIDNRRARAMRTDAMQEGGRIHRKIQRRMDASYRAEVPLKVEISKKNYVLIIEGRADGIIEKERVVIDEIKGIYMDLSYLEDPFDVHLAQAKCYAYIYAAQNGLEQIDVQMTYCNLDTEEIRQFVSSYQIEELKLWFFGVVAEYEKWADFQFEWRSIRQESIREIPFPFSYREGQKELVSDVYRTIYRKKILFIQAPTGVGKTISTIYPAVKAVGENLVEKIFYLTAKTMTASVALETFKLIKEKGYRAKTIFITAKEKMCLCDEMECNPEACPYANGHYDRVNDAVFDLLQEEEILTREVFWRQAEKYQVCPFELCLDTAIWSDHIICDYNYVFDPNVYLRRFFAEGKREEYLFLVDEAHNLVERGRNMYSAVLVKEDFLAVRKLVKPYSDKVALELNQCNKILLQYKRECENYQLYENISNFAFSLMQFGAAADTFLQKNIEFAGKKDFLELYLKVRHFLNMYERLDEHYVIYTELLENGNFCMKLFCVDPSKNLQECLDKGRSTIFFSATLLPIQYYKKLLSTKEDNYAVYAKTAFLREQSRLLIGRDVSSKYTRRTEEEYEKIAQYIKKIVFSKKGNYMVFFPSYRFMESVYEKCLSQIQDQADMIVQLNGMSEEEREAFLEEFAKKREKSLLGFCVLGGIFGEGIDLKEELLIGAIVVGTGIPQIGNEREILKEYFDGQTREGFAYAYRYPGMNKVLQAAGRVIRTREDRGIIALLDERFLQTDYRGLFPREWEDYAICNLENVEQQLEDFWKEP